jgi:small-conductance mechanosensitive channel
MSFLATTGVVLYVVALALVFGGTAALSFAAAPQTFRALKAVDAGHVFGRVLRVFDAMAGVAAAVAIVGGVLAMAETVSAPRIALVVVAASIYAIVTILRKSIAPKMAALKPPETEDEERRWDAEDRRRFDALHKLYVRLYACNLFLSLAGVVLAVIAPR